MLAAMKHPSQRHKRRWSRNRALVLVLAALVVLFYAVTLVRMGGS